MSLRDLANAEADSIENDDGLTDDEKRRYLRDLGEELGESERDDTYFLHGYC